MGRIVTNPGLSDKRKKMSPSTAVGDKSGGTKSFARAWRLV
jgi:hypothetical protein